MEWFSDSQSACKIKQVGGMSSIFGSAPIVVYSFSGPADPLH